MNAFLLRASAASILFACISGCAAPGERAAASTIDRAACPTGETCSSSAPAGLSFAGPSFGDQFVVVDAGPHPIATGGVETIRVHRIGGSEAISFDAKTTGSIAIAKATPPVVTVHAMADGDGYLRIVDPGTDELQDRIQLAAKDVDHVDFVPTSEWMRDDERGATSERFVYLAGAPVELTARLFAADGDRLVDEGLTIEPAAGATAEKSEWDGLRVVATAESATVGVTTTSGATGTVAITAVTGADEIELYPFVDGVVDRVEVGKTIGVCAGARSSGKRLVGGTYTMKVAGAAEGVDGVLGENCLAIQGDAVGTAELTVDVAGVARAFSIDVVPATSGGASSMQALRRSRTEALGERAWTSAR